MKKIYSLIYFLFVCNILQAQINITPLNDVPDSFKKKYYSNPRYYNPLQVGNVWQYYDAEYNHYSSIIVLQDSIINGKKYFKKICYPEFTINANTNIVWERNDTLSGVSFMLDFQDVNENGDSLDELPLDSLENPYWSHYTTYKYSFVGSNFSYPTAKTVHVKDTSWVEIEGDTVISRNFEIIEIFWAENIIEKFGISWNWSESPPRYCTGAIVNGRQYGTIVDIKKGDSKIVNEIVLENNYPNPFNSTTIISYSIPKSSEVILELYDILGMKVKTLLKEYKTSGFYFYKLNMSEFTSGIYVYSLLNNNLRINKKLVYLK